MTTSILASNETNTPRDVLEVVCQSCGAQTLIEIRAYGHGRFRNEIVGFCPRCGDKHLETIQIWDDR